jgi:hypothetical protein
MGATMAIIMLGFMMSMYRNAKFNIRISGTTALGYLLQCSFDEWLGGSGNRGGFGRLDV